MLASLKDFALTTFDVVTTFADRHWEQYARRCVETFNQHWNGIHLQCFSDAYLETRSPWLANFKIANADRATNNYRFDAVRFAHKVAALELAFWIDKSDCLIWMDADCVTHSSVDSMWLSSLLGDADFGYLKRAKKYPECGFLMIRRNQAGARFIKSLVDLYATGELFQLAEWHDSWAIEHVRAHLESSGALRCTSLSGTAENTGHPFVNGPLGERMDHCKGDRKRQGRSRRADLKIQRKEAYWNGKTV